MVGGHPKPEKFTTPELSNLFLVFFCCWFGWVLSCSNVLAVLWVLLMVWKHSKSMLYFESVLESEKTACGLQLQMAFVTSSSSGSGSSSSSSSSHAPPPPTTWRLNPSSSSSSTKIISAEDAGAQAPLSVTAAEVADAHLP